MNTKGRSRKRRTVYVIGSSSPTRVRETGLIHGKEVYAIVGAALEVLGGVGHGFHEKPYENALVVEFGLRGIPFSQQPSFNISYKGHKVGQFTPDLIAFDAIVVDAKTIDRITDHERGQMINYLRITKRRVGVILNFSHAKLEWERIVLLFVSIRVHSWLNSEAAMKIQRALISVTDKAGVVEFAKALAGMGIEVLSTGGTAKALRDGGVAVKDVSDFTGFPEMLDGRVKTLHPKVHAGLLHLRDNREHVETMKQHGLQPIDLVCVNLYAFEATVSKAGVTIEDAIENIDIGGPSMLRSAAKNHEFVTVVSDPADYARVLEAIRQNDGNTTLELRRELAQKVYARTAQYDAAIASYLAGHVGDGPAARPLVLAYGRGESLRYGENPHQEAVFYREPPAAEPTIAHAEVLHGKEMSYNNYVDGDAALEAVKELAGKPAAAIIKHTNPCGYATGETLAEAMEAAWAGDPVSSFGSVIAVTVPVDLDAAHVLKGRFVEALIAPYFAMDALEFLQSKSKDIRLLKLHRPMEPALEGRMVKHVNGGLLLQDRDVGEPEQWMVPTETPFPEEKRALAAFGVKACKHVKSNAIVIVREHKPGWFAILGMGAGQPNRVDSLKKLAVARARENLRLLMDRATQYGQNPKDLEAAILGESVLVSDAFFPFPDNIEAAAEAGIRYIVQPGGSKRDEEVVAACDKYGIAMAITGVRHFRH